MKVKQRSICQNCRTRKIGCDGKRPGCTQCVFTGRKCDGYQMDFMFVSQNPFRKKRTRGQVTTQGNPGKKSHNTQVSNAGHEVLQTPLQLSSVAQSNRDDQIALIVNNYVPEDEIPYIKGCPDDNQSRICGVWVEALPTLSNQTTQDSALSAAIESLATSLMLQNPQRNGHIIDCTHSYHKAIQALRHGFDATDYPFHAEFAAAIMCLSLIELMFPDSAPGIGTHIQGVAQLFQARGPEQCTFGVFHKLFVGFRPLLVIKAFQDRRKTFLGLEEWIRIPFTTMKPSPMQDLLSQASIVPSVLEQIDHLLKAPCQASTSNVGTIINQLVDVLSRLEKWEVTLRQKIATLPHRPVMQGSESELSSPKEPALWFPNVTMANVYIHLWTFQIICLHELEKLVLWFPSIISKKSISPSGTRFGHIQEDIFQLSGQTCSSMEYLLQDKMKLYGPASTIFPLQTVYYKLKLTGPQQENNIARIEATVDRLVQKGLLSAPALVFGENSACSK